MPFYLDLKAEYIEDGDAVLIDVYIFDPDTDTHNPEQVNTGTITLVFAMNDIRQVEFDRRFGNEDGTFKFIFNHPAVSTNMQVRANVELIPESSGATPKVLQKQVPVMRADQPFMPLEEQLDSEEDANGELRSNKRLEELL